MTRASIWYLTLAIALALPAQRQAFAQAGGVATRWVIEPRLSLVWWQVNPHFGHLWGTTCPDDDSWAAGEGRSSQYRGKARVQPRVRQTNVKESGDAIPLFPRDTVRANCRRAIAGDFVMQDGEAMRGARGSVRVRADSLVVGSDMRDAFARHYIYKTAVYREIMFMLDSIAGVQRGDTIRGIAYGLFTFRDGKRAIEVPFRTWDEPSGRRVQGKWEMTAAQLSDDYNVPRIYLAMGVASKLWEELHMGVDLVLQRMAEPGAGAVAPVARGGRQ